CEGPERPFRGLGDAPPPVGCGVLGRGWDPRIKFAGTYGDTWLLDRFPFLPADFDEVYFQSAPADQQAPYFQGGELVRVTNAAVDGEFVCTAPEVEVPLTFRFHDRDVRLSPNLDTLIIEPDLRR